MEQSYSNSASSDKDFSSTEKKGLAGLIGIGKGKNVQPAEPKRVSPKGEDVRVGVYLLPARFAEAERGRLVAQISIVAGATILSAVVIASAVIWRETQELNSIRDAKQIEVTNLQNQVNALQEFKDQADHLALANENLQNAMSGEVSWARIFNDLSMTVPSSSWLETFNATIDQDLARLAVDQLDVEVDPTLTEGIQTQESILRDRFTQPVIGNISISGQTVEDYSPGVETVLVRFDQIMSYKNVFLSSNTSVERSSEEENDPQLSDGLWDFNTEIEIGPKALTGRYKNGLPEVGG